MSMLSPEELARLAPAESLFPSPIPTQSVSSDEFLPSPQTRRQREVEARLKERGTALARRQGMSRRQWEDSLQWMTDRHGMSPLPAKEQKTVLDYLEATFPPRQPAGRGGWQSPFAPR